MKAIFCSSVLLLATAFAATALAQEPQPEPQPEPAPPPRVSMKLACEGAKVRVTVKSSAPTRYVDFFSGSKRVFRDKRKPYVRRIARKGTISVTVRLKDGRKLGLGRSRPGCRRGAERR